MVFDRGWEEKKILGLLRVNNLDDDWAFSAMAWAEEHPHARRESFAAP
jgi:hypothetical protein